ncbi:MAG: hypothetical protein HY298_01905 [Verrucomicrobia bacterium]|nr:hypothetical protein [Verrucomicrobiota bacterium]
MTTKPIQTLLRKRLAARILMWTCLAAAVLPVSAAVLGFLFYSRVNTEPLAAVGLAVAIYYGWPVPLFGLIGFALALEWKQGLDDRIKEVQNKRKGDVA